MPPSISRSATPASAMPIRLSRACRPAIHAVNTFGFLHEDYYIPAQAGVFSLFADIRNNGSRAGTIESVTLQQGSPGSFYPITPPGPGPRSWRAVGGAHQGPAPALRGL